MKRMRHSGPEFARVARKQRRQDGKRDAAQQHDDMTDNACGCPLSEADCIIRHECWLAAAWLED